MGKQVTFTHKGWGHRYAFQSLRPIVLSGPFSVFGRLGLLCYHGLILLLFGGEGSVIIHSSFRQSQPSGMFMKLPADQEARALARCRHRDVGCSTSSWLCSWCCDVRRGPPMDVERFSVEVLWDKLGGVGDIFGLWVIDWRIAGKCFM